MDDVTVLNPSEVPNAILLNPAYPNPFNNVTRINFALPEESYLYLSVVDLNGREVHQILNHQMNAGYHTFSFNGTDLSSGIYYIVARTCLSGSHSNPGEASPGYFKKVVLIK